MSEFQNRFSLEGKKVLLTGASKGIGATTAEVLADAGADLILSGRDESQLLDTAKLVESKHRTDHILPADLTSAEAARGLGKRALEIFDPIDILVNCAGVALVAPFEDLTQDMWDRTLAVNLTAPFALTQEIVPSMIKQGRGKIVNIASQTGVIGADDHAAYAASKGGLISLTRVLAGELGKHNIQINSVCPTVILTPMGEKVWGPPEKGDPMKAKIPLGRFGQPVEVADLVLYLASSASDFMTGGTVMLDGGYTAM
ncbi:SDR family NAD(P)-dependent oxidoreductase [Ancrocorticia populi]|uniref:SDR family NAD(P)-dependent oxidoreductase n=1 Tax=Ancrocorticia populi TaxID=2175228 RepID=UPI003F913D01